MNICSCGVKCQLLDWQFVRKENRTFNRRNITTVLIVDNTGTKKEQKKLYNKRYRIIIIGAGGKTFLPVSPQHPIQQRQEEDKKKKKTIIILILVGTSYNDKLMLLKCNNTYLW